MNHLEVFLGLCKVDMMITFENPRKKMIVSVCFEDTKVRDIIILLGIAIDLNVDERIILVWSPIRHECMALCKELHIPVIVSDDMVRIMEMITVLANNKIDYTLDTRTQASTLNPLFSV